MLHWFIGHLLNRKPLFPLMALAFAISIARWWLTATLTNGVALCVVQTAHAFTFALCYAGSVAHIDKAVAPELRGTGRALYSAISQGAGAICGHLIAGRVAYVYGTPSAFKVGALLELVALAPLMLSAWLEGKQALRETLQPEAAMIDAPPPMLSEDFYPASRIFRKVEFAALRGRGVVVRQLFSGVRLRSPGRLARHCSCGIRLCRPESSSVRDSGRWCGIR